jgi:Tfp pilus assembly protein PilN
MIQFNLLPDVKQEYLKAKSSRQLVTLISVILGAASLAVLVLLFLSVKVVQHKSLSDADDDITAYSKQLKAIPNIDKILTVQNQLNTLTSLHDGKVVSSRLFSYLAQLTPSTISISDITTDYTANTITITGQASSLDQVNVYADTLKETTFATGSNESTTNDPAAFSNVVLSDFDRDDKGATYKLILSFTPDIFSNAADAKLTVPNIVTSPQQQLFQKKATK